MSQLSILILTLNEEINLPDCLASCAWCDDVVVFDSMSTDRTVTIAMEHGARVIQREFDNYAAQRTAALHEVQYKHDWVLMLDADERIPEELATELQTVATSNDPSITLYRMRRKDFFLGKWLRHSSGYPTWFGRLVRPDRVRVERAINEEYLTDGQIGLLQHHLHHLPFNKGIAWWYERHNRYSTMEAKALAAERLHAIQLSGWWSSDPSTRRRTLKQLAYRMPMRPLLIFLYLYLVRRGFLDGKPGYYFSAMRASYELMIDAKTLETAPNNRPT